MRPQLLPRAGAGFFCRECPRPVVAEYERGRQLRRPFHINTIMSPIPTRVYKLVTATPRQTSAMSLICLLRIGTSKRDFSQPNNITREPGIPFRAKVQR
jgi:hypothetical protein